MALQHILNVPRRFDELLNKVNKGALGAAMRSVLNKKNVSQFKLFTYETGIQDGYKVEEVVPGTTTPIADYVHSDEFYKYLIGCGVNGLKFRLWSRRQQDSQIVRELMLEIKKVYVHYEEDEDDDMPPPLHFMGQQKIFEDDEGSVSQDI
jgi:hypothetical protein